MFTSFVEICLKSLQLANQKQFSSCKYQEMQPVSIKHGLRTTDCGLGIKYGLGIKRGLQTVDWV